MNHVFLTGATGVVGSALLPKLLDYPDTEISLLIRANSNEHLTKRATEVLEFGSIPIGLLNNRVHLFNGDVCQPKLGMDPNDYASLANSCTHIVHSAGNVKLTQTIDEARQNLVGATRNILKLADHSSNFRKLDFVSTIGVAGCMKGVIPETELNQKREFHNTYEAAKSEAELVLWNSIREGMPITIHRPSMITGDSQSGRIFRFQVFYYLCDLLTGRRTAGILPQLKNKTLDTIPVDYVAAAIAHSVFHPVEVDVLHLCSGEQALALDRLSENVRVVYRKNGIRCPEPISVPRNLVTPVNAIAARLPIGKWQRFSASLAQFLKYLFEDQVFETKLTDNAIKIQKPVVSASVESLEMLISPFLAFKKF